MLKKILESLKVIGQAAWALIAVGIIVFFIYLWLNDRHRGVNVNAALPAQGTQLPGKPNSQLNLIYGKVLRDEVSHLDLLPVLYRAGDMNKDAELGMRSGKFHSSYQGNQSFDISYSDFNNLILRDPASGAQKLLLTKPGFISDFLALSPIKKSKHSKALGYFFFAMAEKDTNKDGVLNSEDEMGAYVSKRDGSSYWKLSPDGYSFSFWDARADKEAVYLALQEDSNKNGKFEREDAVRMFVALPPDFKKIEAAVGAELDQKLRNMMKAER